MAQARIVLRKGCTGKISEKNSVGDFSAAVVEHDTVALVDARAERDLATLAIHLEANRLAGENRRRKPCEQAFQAAGVVVAERCEERVAGDSISAQAVQDRAVESSLARERWLRMQRVAVRAQAIDQ